MSRRMRYAYVFCSPLVFLSMSTSTVFVATGVIVVEHIESRVCLCDVVGVVAHGVCRRCLRCAACFVSACLCALLRCLCHCVFDWVAKRCHPTVRCLRKLRCGVFCHGYCHALLICLRVCL